MRETEMREELYSFYLQGDAERSRAFADKCFAILDARAEENMSVTAQKLLQYDVICENFEPVIFRYNPYFYETGVLTSLSDGAFSAKGYRFLQANAWVYARNEHLFNDRDPALYEITKTQKKELLYLICGPYNDTSQHFNFNTRPILEMGLKGIFEKAQSELENAKNEEEREFFEAVCHGMVSLRKMAEKFSEKAQKMLETETDADCRENLALIAQTARRVPWEAPQSFYEALATLAFMRTALGSLEGAGPNTFGRLDKDLISFYRADTEQGRLTPEKAYELVCGFLLIWDCHYDHGMIMAGYADHELENTYTLGGCDDDGEPLFNEVTKLFLRATREKDIIFPKIKCRFGKNSPSEYLREVCLPISKGTSTVLLQNDDATIPAILRSGRTLAEARDYMVAGCWDLVTNNERSDHGSYLNLLKPFEYSIHRLTDKIKLVGIDFELIDDGDDFEEIYRKTLHNCELVLDAKLDKARRGGQIFHKVSRFPIFSSTVMA